MLIIKEVNHFLFSLRKAQAPWSGETEHKMSLLEGLAYDPDPLGCLRWTFFKVKNFYTFLPFKKVKRN